MIILIVFFICFVLNRWFFSFNSFRNFHVDDIDIDKTFQNITNFFLIITSTELLFLFIYLISIVLRFLYVFFQAHDINYETFFWMIFNCIKQSYKNFEFMHTIMNKIDISKKNFTINLIIASTSKSWIITYNFKINMFLIIRLHLIEIQHIMLILFVTLIK